MDNVRGCGVTPTRRTGSGTTHLARSVALSISLCLVLLTGCTGATGGGDGRTPHSPAASETSYPGTEDGARALLEEIRPGDNAGLLRSLQPTSADYLAIFERDFAIRAERYYHAWIWSASAMPAEPMAEPDQTELRMWQATTDEIRAWTPSVRENFPGGYKKIKDELKPGLTIYTWDYTRPGAEHGMAYNGLVHVNGHWAFLPKPWYVLEADE